MNISALTTTSPWRVDLYKEVQNKNISTDSVKVHSGRFINHFKNDCERLGKDQHVTRNINVFFDKLNSNYFDYLKQPDSLIYNISNKTYLDKIKNCADVKNDFIRGHVYNREEYKYNDINYVLGKKNLHVRNDVLSIMAILGVIVVLVVIYGKIL